MDVYNVILINPVHFDPESRGFGIFYSGYGLKETLLVAGGQGEDEKGKYVAVAYVQEDRDSAVENESVFEGCLDYTFTPRNWETGEIFEWKLSDHIYDKKIRIEGRVLTAKIYLDDEGFWWWWKPYLVKM